MVKTLFIGMMNTNNKWCDGVVAQRGDAVRDAQSTRLSVGLDVGEVARHWSFRETPVKSGA